MIEAHIGRLGILMDNVELARENHQKLVVDLETCIGWFECLPDPTEEQRKRAAKWYSYRALIRMDDHRAISAKEYKALLPRTAKAPRIQGISS